MIATGYLHQYYAKSFFEFGEYFELPECGGFILKRKIPNLNFYDAMGCYPLFACQDWSKLYDDLDNLRSDIVTLSIVADPFGDFKLPYLNKCFKDIVIKFKDHFLVDLRAPLGSYISKHHRRYARKSLKVISVEKCVEPSGYLDEWNSLYKTLIKRHNIKGITAFSRECFDWQWKVPGIVVFRGIYEEETVGMLSWYIQDARAYYHLGAFSEVGYTLRASFALFMYAIEYFKTQGLQCLDLGAGAGVKAKDKDGLRRFKEGWSNATHPVYFCGRILDHKKYAEIVNTTQIYNHSFFPSYRNGEYR